MCLALGATRVLTSYTMVRELMRSHLLMFKYIDVVVDQTEHDVARNSSGSKAFTAGSAMSIDYRATVITIYMIYP